MEDTTTTPNVNMGLNEAARANMQTGVLLLVKEALVTAMYDRRLDRGHRIVLAAIATCINGLSAKAWPSRETISVMTGLSVKTVSNVISELRTFGYLISEREVVAEANNRRLTVYTFGNVDHDTIRRQITEVIYKMRAERKAEEASATQVRVPRPGGTSPPRGKSEFPSHGECSPPTGMQSSPPAGRSNSYIGTEDKKAADANYWHRQLNPGSPDYAVGPNGVIALSGGAKENWLQQFGSEELLGLALAQISQWVQPNSSKPLSIQVEAQLSRVALERLDKDRRYNKRAAAPEDANKARRERMRRISEEVLEQTRGRK